MVQQLVEDILQERRERDHIKQLNPQHVINRQDMLKLSFSNSLGKICEIMALVLGGKVPRQPDWQLCKGYLRAWQARQKGLEGLKVDQFRAVDLVLLCTSELKMLQEERFEGVESLLQSIFDLPVPDPPRTAAKASRQTRLSSHKKTATK